MNSLPEYILFLHFQTRTPVTGDSVERMFVVFNTFSRREKQRALWPMTGPAMSIHIIRTKEPMPQAYHRLYIARHARRADARRVCLAAFTAVG